MGIIAWIIVGLIAGWLAGMMMGGRGYGVLGNNRGWHHRFPTRRFPGRERAGMGETNLLGSILVAFIGAVLFLLILRAIPGRQPFER